MRHSTLAHAAIVAAAVAPAFSLPLDIRSLELTDPALVVRATSCDGQVTTGGSACRLPYKKANHDLAFRDGLWARSGLPVKHFIKDAHGRLIQSRRGDRRDRRNHMRANHDLEAPDPSHRLPPLHAYERTACRRECDLVARDYLSMDNELLERTYELDELN
ncbi:hypothetical protein DAEQUDRAFT_482452 [Daedalea quercina L-15889]|uniref:Uncharacterized protein n=1 Tax=Daedalea quercina L-15889 TaxID=1314783 RepID=A0A165MUN8_9APHY|nr:hypothetical protein DAEQUDRAFT_482452 [Daedalea quercina L-15889]